MRRKKEDALKTREMLLQAGLDEFLEYGYVRASLESICARANTTRGALYWHFKKGKPELYNSLVSERSAQVGSNIFINLQNIENPVEKIKHLVAGWFYELTHNKAYQQIIILTSFKTEMVEELRDGIKQKQDSMLEMNKLIKNIIADGIKSGVFKADINSGTAAFFCMSLLWGSAQMWLLCPKTFPLKKESERLCTYFLHMLSTKE